MIPEILAYIDGNSTIDLTALVKRNDYKQFKRWRSKKASWTWITLIGLCPVLAECRILLLPQIYIYGCCSCCFLPFTVASMRLGDRDPSKAALSQRQWQFIEAISKPTCSLWARVTCLASANHFLSEANSCLAILCPSGFAVPVQWFPACRKWCPTEPPLMLDTMMLWSDPCFSMADPSPSLGDKLMKLTALFFPDLWLVQGYSLFQWEGQNQSSQQGGTKKKK